MAKITSFRKYLVYLDNSPGPIDTGSDHIIFCLLNCAAEAPHPKLKDHVVCPHTSHTCL